MSELDNYYYESILELAEGFKERSDGFDDSALNYLDEGDTNEALAARIRGLVWWAAAEDVLALVRELQSAEDVEVEPEEEPEPEQLPETDKVEEPDSEPNFEKCNLGEKRGCRCNAKLGCFYESNKGAPFAAGWPIGFHWDNGDPDKPETDVAKTKLVPNEDTQELIDGVLDAAKTVGERVTSSDFAASVQTELEITKRNLEKTKNDLAESLEKRDWREWTLTNKLEQLNKILAVFSETPERPKEKSAQEVSDNNNPKNDEELDLEKVPDQFLGL